MISRRVFLSRAINLGVLGSAIAVGFSAASDSGQSRLINVNENMFDLNIEGALSPALKQLYLNGSLNRLQPIASSGFGDEMKHVWRNKNSAIVSMTCPYCLQLIQELDRNNLSVDESVYLLSIPLTSKKYRGDPVYFLAQDAFHRMMKLNKPWKALISFMDAIKNGDIKSLMRYIRLYELGALLSDFGYLDDEIDLALTPDKNILISGSDVDRIIYNYNISKVPVFFAKGEFILYHNINDFNDIKLYLDDINSVLI